MIQPRALSLSSRSRAACAPSPASKEACVIAAAGSALGLALAWAGIRELRVLAPANLPHLNAVGIVIAHDRRNIIHFNVTRHPTSAWVVQKLREAFPYDSAPRYLIFDRGANFNDHVVDTIKSFGIQPKRTSFQSPWQNGIAERFVGNCRRDLLDHVIVVNGRHLKRLMNAYISYYHDDRTHIGLGKETPGGREAEENPAPDCRVVSIPRLGGLHHRYCLAA